LQDLTNRLAGLPGNKLLTKSLFQQSFKMKTFTPSSKTLILFFMTFLIGYHEIKKSTTNCLQLFGIFIMMQRSCFNQITVSCEQVIRWLGEA